MAMTKLKFMPFRGREKSILGGILLLAILSAASVAEAATISWKLPTTYTDETSIDPANVRKTVVRVYAGTGRTGPWKWVATSLPGATSVVVMDPPPGHTLWFTLKATLDGMESEYADPVRRTNLNIPIFPFLKKIARKMLTVKKMAALVFLLLLAGVAWRIRHRKRRRVV